MEYKTAKEIAILWGVSQRRVQYLCEQGKIPGVTRLGKVWAIPNNAIKPADGRRKQCKRDKTLNPSIKL